MFPFDDVIMYIAIALAILYDVILSSDDYVSVMCMRMHVYGIDMWMTNGNAIIASERNV